VTGVQTCALPICRCFDQKDSEKVQLWEIKVN